MIWLVVIIGILLVLEFMTGVIVFGWNARLTEMHRMANGGSPDYLPVCDECGKSWPCPTMNAIGKKS